jgi:hypothetical protein
LAAVLLGLSGRALGETGNEFPGNLRHLRGHQELSDGAKRKILYENAKELFWLQAFPLTGFGYARAMLKTSSPSRLCRNVILRREPKNLGFVSCRLDEILHFVSE